MEYIETSQLFSSSSFFSWSPVLFVCLSLLKIFAKSLRSRNFRTPLSVLQVDLRFNEQEIERLGKDGLKPVTTEQGEQLVKDFELDAYLECSALTQDGLAEVFEWAARLALAPSNKAGKHPRKSHGFLGKVRKRCLLQ